MSQRGSLSLFVSLCTVLLTLCSGPPSAAAALTNPGIALERTPAPPALILNDGSPSHKIRFDWAIKFDTSCSAPGYTFEILSSLNPDVVVTSFTRACAASTITDFFEWNPGIPTPQPCGCYYGRLTFYSTWCDGSRKIEDQALVAFKVSAAARFRVCKFHDINGSGIWDPATEPVLAGWTMHVVDCVTGADLVTPQTTTETGCVLDEFIVPVNCTGETTVCIREDMQTGWQKTGPSGSLNPFPVLLHPGLNDNIYIGNWQPVVITGFKLLDVAPWPWTKVKYTNPPNPPGYEPLPDCGIQPAPPTHCSEGPYQVIPQPGVENVTLRLFEADGITPVEVAGHDVTTLTDINGAFVFEPVQWRQNLVIKEDDIAADPPTCPTDAVAEGLDAWLGEYMGTVATSIWGDITCPVVNFDDPHRLDITIPPPVIPSPLDPDLQVYGCNYFWNRQPSRLWGVFCQDTLRLMKSGAPPLPNLIVGTVKVYGTPETSIAWPAGNPQGNIDTGVYIVPGLAAEPVPQADAIREGTYRLTPPTILDPTRFSWVVTVWCDNGAGKVSYPLPAVGYVEVTVPHSTDVRVDFCLEEEPNRRQCFQPVTFTQKGWSDYCDPENPIMLGGMTYSKFPVAFANFTYYGTLYHNKMIVGKGNTITYEGTTGGLSRLCSFLPQIGTAGKLNQSYLNPWSATSAGKLAGEVVALQLNIAYNDKRLMPRTPGYDLESFTIKEGPFKGKKVGEVLDIANAVLGGAPPCQFGVPANPLDPGDKQYQYDLLNAVLEKINSNYEFIDFNTFIDRGYLQPNRVFGQPDAAHDPRVPYSP